MLNKKFFKRKPFRTLESGQFFLTVSSALSTLGKIVIQIFFTPIIAASTLSVQGLLLMIANFCMAFGYLANFGFRLSKKEFSSVGGTLTILGIAASVMLAIFISPGLFSASITLIGTLTALSTVATAINIFFLVENIIIPPCKLLVEWMLSFVFNVKGLYISVKPLDPITDRFLIERILGDEPLTQQNKPVLNSYNGVIDMLNQYNSKYHEKIFGSLLLEKNISNMKTYLTNLVVEEKKDFPEFLDKKISSKITKIRMLTESMNTLNHFFDQKLPLVFKEIGLFCPDTEAVLIQPKTYHNAYHILFKERARQEEKAKALIQCIPEESVINKKNKSLASSLTHTEMSKSVSK